MRRRLPILFAAILAPVAFAATLPADPGREAAFTRLRTDARIEKLLDQAAADIKARRYEAALRKAEAAEALRPGDPVALNTKGAALTELHRYDEASRALDAAVAADPKVFAPQFNQGEVLAMQKKYADAAVQFNVLQARFGALPLLKFKIYLCYILDGQKDLAATALRSLRYPEDGPAWYFAQAVDRVQAGQRGEARKLIAVAEAIPADDISTYDDTMRETGLLK